MTIDNEDDLARLRIIGAIVAETLRVMGKALEPGITTKELDDIGRRQLDEAGARSAPEVAYDFPGATCISVHPAVAHGIPGPQVIRAGDLVNIDVSAEKDGLFADTGASFVVPPARPEATELCRGTRLALSRAVKSVRAGRPLNVIGRTVEEVARQRGLSIVRNLQSHGVGTALHEEPHHIPTYFDPHDHRRIHDGMVFTIEPFLSTGADWAEETGDGWTLATSPRHLTAQYEHTLVATPSGAIVVTR